jgi:hypothetical protein
MDAYFWLGIITIIGVISGFIFLAMTLLRISNMSDRTADTHPDIPHLTSERCIERCLQQFKGSPDKTAGCSLLCEQKA